MKGWKFIWQLGQVLSKNTSRPVVFVTEGGYRYVPLDYEDTDAEVLVLLLEEGK